MKLTKEFFLLLISIASRVLKALCQKIVAYKALTILKGFIPSTEIALHKSRDVFLYRSYKVFTLFTESVLHMTLW